MRTKKAYSTQVVLIHIFENAGLAWAQIGGSLKLDVGHALTVSGPSIYVLGGIGNDLAGSYNVVLGSNGTTAGTVPVYGTTAIASRNMLVTKYTSNGPTATLNWTQVGGETYDDWALSLTVSGQSVYAVETMIAAATFGSYAFATLAGANLSLPT